MSQTSIIAGSLLIAYFIFVVVRGELPCYFQVLGIATDASCPKGNTSGTTGTGSTTTTGGNALTGSGSSSAGSVLAGIGIGIGVAGAINHTGIFGPNGPFGSGSIFGGNGQACDPGDPFCGLDVFGIPLAP